MSEIVIGVNHSGLVLLTEEAYAIGDPYYLVEGGFFISGEIKSRAKEGLGTWVEFDRPIDPVTLKRIFPKKYNYFVRTNTKPQGVAINEDDLRLMYDIICKKLGDAGYEMRYLTNLSIERGHAFDYYGSSDLISTFSRKGVTSKRELQDVSVGLSLWLNDLIILIIEPKIYRNAIDIVEFSIVERGIQMEPPLPESIREKHLLYVVSRNSHRNWIYRKFQGVRPHSLRR